MMFEKLIAGVISLSILLFSSYEGNEAKLRFTNASLTDKRLIFQSELIDAFDNDFEEIFKSGQKIEICFSVKVVTQKKVLKKDSFCHTVRYDPMIKKYYIDFEENNKHIMEKSYSKMIQLVSKVNYELHLDFPNEVTITLISFLKTLKLDTMDKEYDLMLLWKLKKPNLKMKVRRRIS